MKIEKNIPIPVGGKLIKWDFLSAMDVGDSFVCTNDLLKNPQVVVGYCNRWAKLSGRTTWKFSQRTLPNGVRVWRIK